MQHRDLYPHEILQDVIDKSYAKSEGHLKTLAILSFLGGGYVSLVICLFKSSERYSSRVEWAINITWCGCVSYLFDLYINRWW